MKFLSTDTVVLSTAFGVDFLYLFNEYAQSVYRPDGGGSSFLAKISPVDVYGFMNDPMKNFMLDYASTFAGTLAIMTSFAMMCEPLCHRDTPKKKASMAFAVVAVGGVGSIGKEMSDVSFNKQDHIDYGDLGTIGLAAAFFGAVIYNHIRKVAKNTPPALKNS
jgi:hypothetical protein